MIRLEKYNPERGDYLFFGDVHLGAFSPELDRKLEQYICDIVQYAKENQLRIVITGDLFDYWMEYRGKWPGIGKRVLECFKDANFPEPVLYVTGNHDAWPGRKLESSGFDIETEYRILKIDSLEVLVTHGDGISDPEMGLERPPLHKFLRNKTFLKVYQAVFPPRAGIGIMRAFSKFSRDMARSKPQDLVVSESDRRVLSIMQTSNLNKLDNWAEEITRKNAVNVVICGHDHSARIVPFREGREMLVSPGPFFNFWSAACYTKGGFHLVNWEPDQNVFYHRKSEKA